MGKFKEFPVSTFFTLLARRSKPCRRNLHFFVKHDLAFVSSFQIYENFLKFTILTKLRNFFKRTCLKMFREMTCVG